MQNITLSVDRGGLGGPDNLDTSLRAITVTRGSAESNPALKSQIRIMSEIIDAAFEEDTGSGQHYVIAGSGYYFGGASGTQYIPGYGIIFTKNARMNLVTVLDESIPLPPAPDAPPAAAGSRAAERADQTARERTITLYIDKDPFKSALGIESEDDIHLFLVDREGEILWRSSGEYTEGKASELIKVIDRYAE